MKKVLLIGPFSPPITGESLANDVILKNFSKDLNFKIDYINNAYPVFNEKLGKFSFLKTWFYIKQYIKFYKILKTQTVYLTLGQTFFGVIKYAPYIIFSKCLNKEVIIHIHGNYLRTEYESLKGYKKGIVKKVISTANKGIVLSESLKPNLNKFIQEQNIYILPNFVENYLIEPLINLENIKDTNSLKILFLSNLMIEKGILDLLNALEMLNKKGINYEAKIAGNIDNSIKEIIIKKISENNSVKYLGVVLGNEKKNLLHWSNVFVFPSYYKLEGQPISLLEAMATGNIVLTTNHAGIPDVFSSLNGFYFNKQNPYDLAKKLQFVEENLLALKSKMIHNCKYASSSFTEEKFINSLKKIFLRKT